MTEIEEMLRSRYPDLKDYEIWELKNRLVEFYVCCAKVAIKSVRNQPSCIPVNSSSFC